MSGGGPGPPGRLGAILALRCPVCLEGAMFHSLLGMNETCPKCGHRFMREPGYFQGAMYVSYAMGLVTFAILLLGGRALASERVSFFVVGALALAGQFLITPILWRYSRVIWAHLNVGTRQNTDQER